MYSSYNCYHVHHQKKKDGSPTPKSAGPVAARALVEEHRNVARSVGKRPAVAAQDVKSVGFLKLEFMLYPR